MKSGLPFLGRDALEKAAGEPLPRILAGFSVDDPGIPLLGRETIYRDGERVGWLSSAGVGYSIGKPIGYGYVRRPTVLTPSMAMSGNYELDVAGKRVPAAIALQPFFDPRGARIRG